MLIPIQPVTVDPEKVAFQMCESGEQVTFAQLEDRANQVARLVSDLGHSSRRPRGRADE